MLWGVGCHVLRLPRPSQPQEGHGAAQWESQGMARVLTLLAWIRWKFFPCTRKPCSKFLHSSSLQAQSPSADRRRQQHQQCPDQDGQRGWGRPAGGSPRITFTLNRSLRRASSTLKLHFTSSYSAWGSKSLFPPAQQQQ